MGVEKGYEVSGGCLQIANIQWKKRMLLKIYISMLISWMLGLPRYMSSRGTGIGKK